MKVWFIELLFLFNGYPLIIKCILTSIHEVVGLCPRLIKDPNFSSTIAMCGTQFFQVFIEPRSCIWV